MERTLFQEEHDIFRQSFRKFVEKHIIPYHEQWEKDGIVPRDLWLKAGAEGFLCAWLDEEYGGVEADFLYSVVIIEEMARACAHGPAFSLHSDVVSPYIYAFGNEKQKKRWLPQCVTGEKILALAMTEPGAGSDVAAMRTTAIRDGDHYVVNGQKTFITNGILSDIVVTAVKTDPKAEPAHSGVSLLVIERETPGFERGRNLEKLGIHAQDTAELSFEDCRVPVENLLGTEGAGFIYMMQKLQQERLVIAIGSQAGAEKILESTIEYCKDRELFGQPLSKFQNTRFKIAEMATEIEIGRVFMDRLIQEHMAGSDVVTESTMAKYWTPQMQIRVVDECLQLHGGYGYMMEYPVAKFYIDTRVQTIYGGTNEVMKEIISRRMEL